MLTKEKLIKFEIDIADIFNSGKINRSQCQMLHDDKELKKIYYVYTKSSIK